MPSQASTVPTLGDVCAANLLHTKWLLVPSHRVGHQWTETLVRGGQSVVNMNPTTALQIALEVVGSDLATQGLTLASHAVGEFVVDAAWSQLAADGYLSRLEQSAELSAAVYASLLSLRLAGCNSDKIDESRLESKAKGKDLLILLKAYEEFLTKQALVDEADVLRQATARMLADPGALSREFLILIPQGFRAAGLEREFLDALPSPQRITIAHPAGNAQDPATDIRLLGRIGHAADYPAPIRDGSVQFFRAVGEVNEIREVLRRCLADGTHLDNVEVLHTDAETYVPLIYATARRYFSEPDRPDGVPITFAEGIPTSLSRPGRALSAWLHWTSEGYPQRLLVEMIGEGLLDCGDDEDLSFSSLVRLLRPIAIGLDADNYLPKIDEQIQALRKAPPKPATSGDDNAHEIAAHERKLKGFTALRKLIAQLLKLSRDVATGSGKAVLAAAESFLAKSARSVSELDRYAAEALLEQLRERQFWLERLGVELDLGKWLVALPSQTKVLGSGPQPGHLHVAHISAGGQSGRKRTFVVGLDDRRFPGAALQDPILLDRERNNLSSELSTSATRLHHKIEDVAAMLSRLSGSVTLSWPCLDLAADQATFPASIAMAANRLISGLHDADLEALNSAVGPPLSFAPTTANKALDEAERWLWRLSDEEIQGTDQIALVEAHYPHLARGGESLRQQAAGFGPFNGSVPAAGKDLNPFAAESPVLSASAWETAGRCPRAFFFRNGLKLYPPEEMEVDLDRWLDAAQFGLLLHDVFRSLMVELCEAGQRPQFERDHVRLAKILQEAVEQWRQEIPPPNENAFRMQYWQLVRCARIFLQDEEGFCQTSQPRFFEVALGTNSVASGSVLDDAEPVKVVLPSGRSVRAKGQIDRVDETAAHRFAVWDYKISSGYGFEENNPFRQGRRLQSVLYLQMIETALRAKHDSTAMVERFGYFFPSLRGQGRRIQWDAKELAAGTATLERLCSLVAEGAFPATNNADDCQFCDYKSICGDATKVAAQGQRLLERDDILPLLHFRELRRGK